MNHSLAFLFLLACNGEDTDETDTVDPASDLRTLENCGTDVATGLPSFFRRFACVTATGLTGPVLRGLRELSALQSCVSDTVTVPRTSRTAIDTVTLSCSYMVISMSPSVDMNVRVQPCATIASSNAWNHSSLPPWS